MKLIDPRELLDVTQGAQYLLGCVIKRTLPDGRVLKAKIVETESYYQEDPASHTFRGQTERTKAMFGPAGHAYIYFTYGMHWCFNVTAGAKGYGAGILIRAVEPLAGIEIIRKQRKVEQDKNLANGPAKLAEALFIDKELYGQDLSKPPLQLYEPQNREFHITSTTRIGISRAVDEIARYYITNSAFISKP